MPAHPFVSGKEILARVIRSLGYKLPSTYHDDILEWIPEGMGFLELTNSLVKTSSGNLNCPGELLVTNHCVPLPKGFIAMLAVEDEHGKRLPLGGDVTDITSPTSIRHQQANTARASVFEVNPYQHQTSNGVPTEEPGTSVPIYGEDLEAVTEVDSSNSYYQISGNQIQTSFEEGFIKIHYLALPICDDGYPLIPDNQNYKQALEWHIIRRLIGSGYQHPVFNYQYAEQQFEKYAGRAANEISYPSLDGAAKLNRAIVRLIPPFHFADDFFINSESPEQIRK